MARTRPTQSLQTVVEDMLRFDIYGDELPFGTDLMDLMRYSNDQETREKLETLLDELSEAGRHRTPRREDVRTLGVAAKSLALCVAFENGARMP